MRQVFGLGLVGLVLVFSLFIGFTGWTTVDSGQVGVVSLFGKVQEGYLDEGFHLKNPLAKVTPFDAKQKTLKITLDIPTQDQFLTSMDVSIQYRLIKELAPRMLKETGSPQEVIDVHMEPRVRSLVRELGKSIAKAEDLFTQKVQQRLQSELFTGVANLSEKGVKISELLIRKVTLPKIITDAVARKKQAAQEAEKAKEDLNKFKVDQEKKEAQALAEKRAEVIDAEKKKEVLLIQANAQLEASRIEAQSVIVKATAEAEAKKKQIDVLSQAGYLKLEAMRELGRLANGNHVFVMDGDSAQPIPFMNMTDMLKK